MAERIRKNAPMTLPSLVPAKPLWQHSGDEETLKVCVGELYSAVDIVGGSVNVKVEWQPLTLHLLFLGQQTIC